MIIYLINRPPHGDDGLIWVVLFLIFLAYGVPIILALIGLYFRKKNKKVSKILFIIAAVYALIGLGVCSGVF